MKRNFKMQLPADYVKEMKELLGEDFPKYEKSFERDGSNGLRVNTSKISVTEFQKIAPFTLKRIPWIDNGFFYETNENVTKHPYYFAGLYYIQEPSAMTPANRLPISQGDFVLDMCAAPGGKATELVSKLKGSGMLMANDISNSRAKALLKNLELFGHANICVTSENPEKLATIYPQYFEKILIDAPCSGEGMFRREPRMVNAWQERGPEYYSEIQKELVVIAAKMLKNNGEMLYSTCTFSKAENEEVIKYLLEQEPSLELITILPYEGFVKGVDGLEKCVRIFPHNMEGEGHFMALLKKKGQSASDAPRTIKAKDDVLPPDVQEFLKQIKKPFSKGYFRILSDKVYFIPQGYEVNKKIRYLRSGLYVGEVKKKRFEPSQALAMILKMAEFKAVVNLAASDIRVIKYLKGETIDVSDSKDLSEKGWQLICVDGYSLGFGKLQRGILKNKYYQGWRMN